MMNKNAYEANRNIQKPLYQLLADRIGEEIIAGNLKNGDFYSTLKQLCDRFDASIITIRKAVSLLEDNGILHCKTAIGLYVHDIHALTTLNSFRNIILILHRHSLKQLTAFYEIRLSAMLQVFSQAGYSVRVIYGNSINLDTIKLISGTLKGIVCGQVDAQEILELHQFAEIPLLLLNPSGNYKKRERTGAVYYDLEGQKKLTMDYLQKLSCKHVTGILSVPGDRKEDFISQDWNEYPQKNLSFVTTKKRSLDAGKKLVRELNKMPSDTVFWVSDDFVALGIYLGFLERGIDLIKTHRILANSSPSLTMTSEFGLPVIGFSPMEFGMEAAKYFIRMLKSESAKSIPPLYVSASANEHVLIHK